MTIVSRASHLGQDGITAQEARRQLFHATGGVKGVYGATHLAVTAGTGLQVSVAGGAGLILGTEQTYQGSYFAENQAAELVNLDTADPTNPRWDLIVLKVQDADVSGATNAASIVKVTGTPAGSPSEPAVPANAIRLARVVVNASATVPSSIVDQRLTDSQIVVTQANGRGIIGYDTSNTATTFTNGGYTAVAGLGVTFTARAGMAYEIVWNTGDMEPTNADTFITFRTTGLVTNDAIQTISFSRSVAGIDQQHTALVLADNLVTGTSYTVGVEGIVRFAAEQVTKGALTPGKLWVRESVKGY